MTPCGGKEPPLDENESLEGNVFDDIDGRKWKFRMLRQSSSGEKKQTAIRQSEDMGGFVLTMFGQFQS